MDDLSLLLLFAVAVVPLVPTELALITMGVTAANGGDPLPLVVLVAAVGCLLCDVGLYAVGWFGGARLVDRLRARPSVAACAHWITRHLDTRGVAILVLARWLPAGGTVGAVLAGSLRWSRRRFLCASLIGVSLWCAYTGGLGYLGGALLEQSRFGIVLPVACALLAAFTITTVFRRTTSWSARA
ncbi:DedA family protein [Saccharomonospora glauca]|uniref:Putative membrane-associated protein n=1 Tax=Saccharomonospora glauca K62 TaxID=928724 RepID=I1D7F2_9PSEU|nr:VTT domain-containing protein [Saccharomonospora glauca]EIF00877.1 putative membrane-associated protein [Saccharomonospora glauca K62]